MCGRYKLSTPGDELWESFDIHGEQLPLVPRFNIAPTQPIAIIREPHQLEFLRWGLTLPNPKSGGFNVRVESLNASFYRDSIQGRRCLILADGFYEWKVLGDPAATKKPVKQPYLIRRPDGKPFAFAGIWDNAQLKNGEVVPACAILTTTPRGVAGEVHDRMPVILPEAARGAWLDSRARYRDLLEPDADLELVAVSSRVNSVKNDDPDCALTMPAPNSA
ncbi:MAG: SOS response-associated peptidase [Pseudomonadota bacterium]